MSIISLSATAAQKDAAVYLFGSKGHSIIAAIEALAKSKELNTPHLNGLMAMLKEAEDDEIIKFKNSAGGKKSIEAAKQLVTAKTLVTSIKALRAVKVPSKWIPNHDDVKNQAVSETVVHRATGRGTRPKKAEQMVNPQAPEAEEIDDYAQYADIKNLAAKVQDALEEDHEMDVKITGHAAKGKGSSAYMEVKQGRRVLGSIFVPYAGRQVRSGEWFNASEITMQVESFEHNDMVYDKMKGLGLIDVAGSIADKFAELAEKANKGPDTTSRRKDGARMEAVTSDYPNSFRIDPERNPGLIAKIDPYFNKISGKKNRSVQARGIVNFSFATKRDMNSVIKQFDLTLNAIGDAFYHPPRVVGSVVPSKTAAKRTTTNSDLFTIGNGATTVKSVKRVNNGGIEIQFAGPKPSSVLVSTEDEWLVVENKRGGQSGWDVAAEFLNKAIVAAGSSVVEQSDQAGYEGFKLPNDAEVDKVIAYLAKLKINAKK
ncbi:hypothetical protein YOLOSWAG_243 [Erwinia phage vB_EamM_Yoloswag]|uniref:Uncharacterized protein n=1 Tax=Erwinia phage vB_EamM_Yoloswag TaxID=1958956 RepID=A0A1S6L3I9_9CAUD|nr:hypothetical protein HOR66_gp243 [Erwinia phage vB_EamM_Yoloswag]AQT28719.1 hypothetical protein YOLOSWAG_243 [Erwinia phage vB_EamM_Yoloswag]